MFDVAIRARGSNTPTQLLPIARVIEDMDSKKTDWFKDLDETRLELYVIGASRGTDPNEVISILRSRLNKTFNKILTRFHTQERLRFDNKIEEEKDSHVNGYRAAELLRIELRHMQKKTKLNRVTTWLYTRITERQNWFYDVTGTRFEIYRAAIMLDLGPRSVQKLIAPTLMKKYELLTGPFSIGEGQRFGTMSVGRGLISGKKAEAAMNAIKLSSP